MVALPIEDVELIEALVLRFLPSDILPNGGLVSAYRGDIVASRPEVLAREALPSPEVAVRDVDGDLPLPLMNPRTCDTTYFGGIGCAKTVAPIYNSPCAVCRRFVNHLKWWK